MTMTRFAARAKLAIDLMRADEQNAPRNRKCTLGDQRLVAENEGAQRNEHKSRQTPQENASIAVFPVARYERRNGEDGQNDEQRLMEEFVQEAHFERRDRKN